MATKPELIARDLDRRDKTGVILIERTFDPPWADLIETQCGSDAESTESEGDIARAFRLWDRVFAGELPDDYYLQNSFAGVAPSQVNPVAVTSVTVVV